MKKIPLYLSFHLNYLIFLFCVFVIPLGLFFQFSSYPLPKVQYAVLACLFASQYAFYQEKAYRAKLADRILEQLKKELGRTPSIKEIGLREDFAVEGRLWSLVVVAVSIICLMVYFKQF